MYVSATDQVKNKDAEIVELQSKLEDSAVDDLTARLDEQLQLNDDYKSQILSYRETLAATPVPISDPAIDDRKDIVAKGSRPQTSKEYLQLSVQAEKEALDEIWMERLEKFKRQSEDDMDELEKLKNDSLVQTAKAQAERDEAIELLRTQKVEMTALREMQAIASSASDPGIIALHERIKELHNVCIEQSNGRNEYKAMYETLVRECYNRLELRDFVDKSAGTTPHHNTLATNTS